MKKDESKNQKRKKSSVRIWIENIIEILIVIVCITFSIITIANPGGIKRTGDSGNYDYSKTNVSFMPVLSNSMSGTFEKNDIIFGDKVKKDKDGNYPVLDIGEVIIFVIDSNILSDTVYINTHRIVGYYYEYRDPEDNILRAGYEKMFGVESVVDAKTALEYANNNGWTDFLITGYKTSGDNKSIYYKDGIIGGELIVPTNTNLVDNGHVELNQVIGIWNGKKVSKLGGIITWIKQPLNFFLVIMIPLILLFAYNIFILVKYIIELKTAKARKLALEEAKASAPSLSAEEEEEIKRKAVEEYMKKMGIDPNSLPKNDDSSNDDKEEKASVVEPVSDDKVVDEKPVAKKKTTKKSTTGTKKTTKSSKKDGAEEK